MSRRSFRARQSLLPGTINFHSCSNNSHSIYSTPDARMHETKSSTQGLQSWLKKKFQFGFLSISRGYFSPPLYLSLHTSSGPLIHPPIQWLSDLERLDCWVTDVLDAFPVHPATPLSNPCSPFTSFPFLSSTPFLTTLVGDFLPCCRHKRNNSTPHISGLWLSLFTLPHIFFYHPYLLFTPPCFCVSADRELGEKHSGVLAS